MIPIDYVPGSHGRFLSFVCNQTLTDIPYHVLGDTPFTERGTSHHTVDTYWQSRYFQEAHYYMGHGHYTLLPHQAPGLQQWSGPVIQIWFDRLDLLTLTATSFLRASDVGVDINTMHIDTFNKLNNDNYRSMLEELQALSLHNLLTSVQAVRDPSWPWVDSWQQWQELPQHIKDECVHQHGVRPWQLDQEHPDCPIWVIREYFRQSFRDGARNGFIQSRDRMQYRPECAVWRWQFSDFFDTQKFVTALEALAAWLDRPVRDLDRAVELHREFLQRHQYRDSLPRCQAVLDSWAQNRNHALGGFSTVEQAWIECQIEQATGRSLHQDRVGFWNDLDEIRGFLA